MSAETWVNVGVLIVSALAALISWRQAVAAARSESASSEHAASILEAQQKLAAAVARQTEMREADERRRVKWEAVYVSGERWDILNQTGFRATAMVDSSDSYIRVREEDEDFREVEPGSGFSIEWPDRYSSPRHAELNVLWIAPEGVQSTPVALRR